MERRNKDLPYIISQLYPPSQVLTTRISRLLFLLPEASRAACVSSSCPTRVAPRCRCRSSWVSAWAAVPRRGRWRRRGSSSRRSSREYHDGSWYDVTIGASYSSPSRRYASRRRDPRRPRDGAGGDDDVAADDDDADRSSTCCSPPSSDASTRARVPLCDRPSLSRTLCPRAEQSCWISRRFNDDKLLNTERFLFHREIKRIVANRLHRYYRNSNSKKDVFLFVRRGQWLWNVKEATLL